MTSCLNTVSYISLQRVYKHHGLDLTEIVYLNSIGLRMFRPDRVGPNMLGYCVGIMPSLFHNELIDCADNSELRTKFWPIARRNQLDFEKRVANDLEKFDYMPTSNPEDGRLFTHIGLSNLGVLETRIEDTFRIDDQFIVVAYDPRIKFHIVFGSVCTVAGRLCWCPSFNAQFIDQFIVNECEKQTIEVIDMICKE